MSMVPIGSGHANDAAYRYKMPRLINKVEGRGNGIKTAIPNMLEIAKALHVHPRYPTKFFGLELGAQSKWNEAAERAIVNGAHTQQDLAALLDKFVDLFVLCPTCRLPEISWVVHRNSVDVSCAACGFHGKLPSSNHRLVAYILKHHQSAKAGIRSVKDKRREKQRRSAVKKKSGSKSSKSASAADQNGGDLEEAHDDWYTDTSTKAQEKRRQEEFSEMKSQDSEAKKEVIELLQQAKQVAPGQLSPVTVLQVFLAEKKREPHEIIFELKRLQMSRGFDDSAKIKILIEALVDTSDSKTVAKQFQQHGEVFSHFCTDESSARTFLDRVEEFVGITNPELLPRIPMILQALDEIIPDEAVLEWANSAPESNWLVRRDVALAVRKTAKVYTDWLAESEDEGDEGDEETEVEEEQEE